MVIHLLRFSAMQGHSILMFHLAMQRGQLLSDTKYLVCCFNLNCPSETMLLFILSYMTSCFDLSNFELIFYSSCIDSFFVFFTFWRKGVKNSTNLHGFDIKLNVFAFVFVNHFFLELVWG